MRFIWRSMASLVLLGFSGCAIYTPFEVKRFCFDWNSERQMNAQIEKFDHLPPKVTRVRLMRWGYNIGAAGACPVPVSGGWGGRNIGAPEMNGPRTMWNEMPPEQIGPESSSPPTPPQPMPLIPPAPPADPPEPSQDFGPQTRPSANRGPTLQPASHRTSQTHRSTANRTVSNAGWMFSAP